MDELRESSLLFSLESLLETERDRVQREAREAQKRRDDELKRVAELGERRRVAAQQAREARERRVLLEQERDRQEQERLEAMKRATVERARIEAEGQLRIVEVEQARQHDLALAKVREVERAAHHRTVSFISVAAVGVVLGGALFGFFGLIQPAHAQQEQQLRALVGVAEARARRSESALADARAKNLELLQQVTRLKQDAAQPPAAAPKATPQPPRAGPRGTRGSEPARDEICPDDGDPLSRCLGKRRR
jgi:hypothetical protein